jgi:hypothetical protein
MFLFFGGFFYGIIFLGMLIYCLFLTAAVYIENVGDLPSKDEDDAYDTYGMVLDALGILGTFRSILWVVIAFLWPVSLPLLLVLSFWEKSRDGLPHLFWDCALALFLCFGKFKPQEENSEIK